jgi:hypothetical protein
VPAFGVGVLVEGDGRREECRRDARDDDRRHRPGRAGVGVLEQCDWLQHRRGDALEDALDDFASHHRHIRVDRRARVVLRAVCQPPYLDGGLEAGQHQDKLYQHGQLAVVLGHDDGQYRLRSHKWGHRRLQTTRADTSRDPRTGGPDLRCHGQADHRDHRVRRAKVVQGEQSDGGVYVGDQVARAEQRRDDRTHHDAGQRLEARDDALGGARHDVALGHPAQTTDSHTNTATSGLRWIMAPSQLLPRHSGSCDGGWPAPVALHFGEGV